MVSVHNVAIGDRFQLYGRCSTVLAEVVDILEKRSLKNGGIVGYICVAKRIGTTLATNEFDVPFSTVVRNRILQA